MGVTTSGGSGRRTRSCASSPAARAMAGESCQAPKGTFDVLRRDARASARVARAGRRVLLSARATGVIETPIFEATELFARGVGESTDIVQKEMYTFEDQGGRSLTLRPEGTAPVIRAYLEHGMHKLAAAGEAVVRRAVLPPRAPAGRPLPPVRAGRRGGDRLRRPVGRRRGDPAARELLRRSARAGCGCGSLARHADDAARVLRRPARTTCARTRPSCPTRCARASTPTRCARSTPTTAGRRP